MFNLLYPFVRYEKPHSWLIMPVMHYAFAKKPFGCSWKSFVFSFFFFTSSIAWSEETILITEDTPVPTASPSVPSTPTAIPTPSPVPATPTPTPPPQPEKTQTSQAENNEGAAEMPAKTSTPAEEENPYAPKPLPFGLLPHPLLSIVVDGLYAKGFNGNTDNGVGGEARAEIQVTDWLAMGIYYDFETILSPNQTQWAAPLGLMGRLFLPEKGSVTPFLIGGLGLNSTVKANAVYYPGNFHGFAGLGLKVSFKDKWGLDLGCDYNYFSPQIDPLECVSVRVGLSYEIGL